MPTLQRDYETRSRTRGRGASQPEKKKEEEEEAAKPKKGRPRGGKAQAKGSTKRRKTKEAQEPPETKILEKGLIYFFYRPKVEVKEVHNLNEVQRLHIVLWPEAPTMAEHEKKSGRLRMIGVSKKTLPSTKKHQVNFAFVEMVTDSVDDIKKDLGPADYETRKTHKEHHLEGARPLGEGIYALVKHGEHTHLVYVLEQPKELGPVQKAFGLGHEESMIISVKNPHIIEGHQKPTYPPHLQELFQGPRVKDKRFIGLEDVQLLEFEGTQLLLIGVSDDLVQEFGEVGEEVEHLAEMDAPRMSDSRLFEELHLKRKENPPQPLLEGQWK